MPAKKRGLGRNLEALLGASAAVVEAEPEQQATQVTEAKEDVVTKTPSTTQHTLSVTKLSAGQYQPRRDMADDGLQELAASIKKQGILQPILVRELAADKYEIIAGERRFRAAQLAGLDEVPVVVKQVSDQDAMAMALIENMQREDLNVIEEALAMQRLVDEFKLTHQQIAEILGKSRTAITNALRLLNLAPDVRLLLERGDLEMGHGRTLVALPENLQREIAKLIVEKGLSVRETEDLVRLKQSETKAKDNTRRHVDPDILRLQQRMSERLGALVRISHSQTGKGKVVISYKDLKTLEKILTHFES